jgi:hypothetical protein
MASPNVHLAGGEAPEAMGMAGSTPLAEPVATVRTLFTGVPPVLEGEAVLFDSSRSEDASKLPESCTLTSVQIRFLVATPDAGSVDPGLMLLIFIEDLSQPRARVRVADLIRQRGERPLNLLRRPGERVKLVLFDAAGVWARDGEAVEVEVGIG